MARVPRTPFIGARARDAHRASLLQELDLFSPLFREAIISRSPLRTDVVPFGLPDKFQRLRITAEARNFRRNPFSQKLNDAKLLN
ncbi:MAG: hypothetical protein SF069_01000 [Phycisphaerae bacterium]|nr:hypothetical protein [Phycisphaerae bacterium]